MTKTSVWRGMATAVILTGASLTVSVSAIAASLESEGAFPGESITLTSAQREKIVRAIIRHGDANVPNGEARVLGEPKTPGGTDIQSLPAPSAEEITQGAAVPQMTPLTPLPDSIGVEIPAVRRLSYALVDGRLLLVDPATNMAVAEINP
jgi:Protein of unknown function (DUF1236)